MKIFRYLVYIFIVVAIFIFAVNLRINTYSKSYIYDDVNELPECYTAIVLGAFVYKSGNPSSFLKYRLDKAIELYKNKKIKKFLLSGDHGQKDYDEVNNMKNYLMSKGISTKDIFLDHAGFDTYNSVVRAKEIFEVDNAIIISQGFHLPRAVYIARSKGLDAYGAIADNHSSSALRRLKFREVFANIKAFIEISINKRPRFLGDKIPITGNSKLSYD